MPILQVPYIDQSKKWPTGCESVSAVMLLRHLGIDIGVDDFIRDNLDTRPFETRNGQLYGADPRRQFAGNPYDADAFGCYAPVIRAALEKALGPGWQVVDETGKDLPALCREYIDDGMPVVTWACINMREPITGPHWKLLDTGEPFTWISNEHCMLLVGYDEENYIFNDPHENNGVIAYPRPLTEARHRAQYSQAVGVKKL